MLLQTENVSYAYKLYNQKIDALKNINLKIFENEFIIIMGSTGSGKSTLLQILNFILKPTQGKIFFKGEEINFSEKNIRSIRRKIGLLFQFSEQQLFAETVAKDIAFGPSSYGIKGEKLEELVINSLETVDLDPKEYSDRSPFSLSGGEQRKVAFAGILALEPEILLLDEPTIGLDPQSREELFILLSKLYKEKKITIIMSSHRIEEFIDLATRFIVLKEGRIVVDEKKDSFFKKPDLLMELGLELPLGQKVLQSIQKKGYSVNTELYKLKDVEDEIVSWFRGGEHV